MDEQYFTYGEDIDYCLRTKKAGWKIVYYPKIVGVHHHGATTKQQKVKSLARFHRAMFIYYKKHIAPTKNALVNGIVYFGIFLRFSFFATYHCLKNLLGV
jgi:GT2 family glycosyltransferase